MLKTLTRSLFAMNALLFATVAFAPTPSAAAQAVDWYSCCQEGMGSNFCCVDCGLWECLGHAYCSGNDEFCN